MLFSPCKYKNDNKGFSLVELIVVVAISATMIGVMALQLSLIFSRDAESVAKTISDELTEARMMSMTKPGNFTMTIHCGKSGGKGDTDEDNYITIKNDLTDANKVDTKILFGARAYIGIEGETLPRTSSGDIEITFNKVNGSVESISDGGSGYASASGAAVYKINCKAVNADKNATVEIMTVSGRNEVVK